MFKVYRLLWSALTGLFRSRARLEAEILILQQQINVLRRKSPFTRGSNVLRNQFPEHPRLQDQQSSRGPVDVIVQPSTPCLNRSFPRRSTFTTPSDLAEYFRSSSMADMESGKCLPPRHYQIDKSLKSPILIGA